MTQQQIATAHSINLASDPNLVDDMERIIAGIRKAVAAAGELGGDEQQISRVEIEPEAEMTVYMRGVVSRRATVYLKTELA